MTHWALKLGGVLAFVAALAHRKRKRPVGRHVAHVYREIEAVGRRSAYEDWSESTGSTPESRGVAG